MALLRSGALACAIGAAAFSVAQDWGADTIWVVYLPTFVLMGIVMHRRDRAGKTSPPIWVRMVLPAIAVAGGIAAGVTEDATYLALMLVVAVATWSAFPATMD